jgi:hypothetical protein
MNISVHDLIHGNQWRYRLLRHGLFWLVYLIGYSFIDLAEYDQPYAGLALAVRWMPFTVLNTYVTLYWLVERFLLRSRYWTFLLWLTVWTILLVPLAFFSHLYLCYPYCWAPGPRPSLRQALPELFDLYPIFVCEVISGFAVFLRMHKFWRVEMFQKLQLKQEKTQAELALLKAQLHPHFLFNTLNNLYMLILRESDRAPDMLRRLTGILNYVLNECHADQVPLEREIAFCRDYIDLEKERYGDRLDIDVMFSGDLENKFITPMLFQPFIENAFKHGASKQVGQVWIDIRLTVLDNQLEFIVTNSAAPAHRAPASGGIGIANIHRRLQLLYPDRHRFVREQQEGMYSIALTIELPTRPKVRSIVRPSSPSSIANARLQFHLEKK